MRLFLIRHAVTAETGKRLSGRTPGISLSPEGKAMADGLAERLSAVTFDAIYTSPIERCRETAAAVASARRVQPKVNKAFTEADFGRWTGRTLNSLYRLKAWQELMTSASRFRFPDGETLAEVQHRAIVAIETMATQHKKKTVAIASHSDVIRVVLAHYLGTPLDLVHRLDVRPASVSIVQLYPSGPVWVPVVNHVSDLRSLQ